MVHAFFQVIGMGDFLDGQGIKLFLRVADNIAVFAVDPQPAAIRCHMTDADRGLVEGGAEALLAFMQICFHPFALGDVIKGQDRADYFLIEKNRLAGKMDRKTCSVLPQERLFTGMNTTVFISRINRTFLHGVPGTVGPGIVPCRMAMLADKFVYLVSQHGGSGGVDESLVS